VENDRSELREALRLCMATDGADRKTNSRDHRFQAGVPKLRLTTRVTIQVHASREDASIPDPFGQFSRHRVPATTHVKLLPDAGTATHRKSSSSSDSPAVDWDRSSLGGDESPCAKDCFNLEVRRAAIRWRLSSGDAGGLSSSSSFVDGVRLRLRFLFGVPGRESSSALLQCKH
jgi:hypothetical protein